MKYIIDLDALKNCLNLLYKPFSNDGEDLVYLADVQEMLDRFPKDEVKS